eukprot:TRINITY_DN5953_c0_g1_i2.p1 TRINITY_DN5953_c0_g1~~TRINITY_DN5953_c0_g1_i2.p1  ORF type:complete len:434 (+),score=74.92 TRINITY_DN5953_c0_g1_i2:79-1380(+)
MSQTSSLQHQSLAFLQNLDESRQHCQSIQTQTVEIFERYDKEIETLFSTPRQSLKDMRASALAQLHLCRSMKMKRMAMDENWALTLKKSITSSVPPPEEMNQNKLLTTRSRYASLSDFTFNPSLYASRISYNIPSNITIDTIPAPKSNRTFVSDGMHLPSRDVNSITKPRATPLSGSKGSPPLNKPYCVRVHPLTGNFYVSELWNHRVREFDSSWKGIHVFGKEGRGMNDLKYPRGIAISDDGTIAIVDNDNHRFYIIRPNHPDWVCVGRHGADASQFSEPYNVIFDDQGCIYITDRDNHRIQKFTNNGAYMTEWKTFGVDGLACKPEGIAINSRKEIYVCFRTTPFIAVYTTTGQLIRHVKITASGSQYCDICLTADDGFAISDCARNIVRFYQQDGTEMNSIEVDSPVGMVFGLDDTFYVISKEKNEIFSF